MVCGILFNVDRPLVEAVTIFPCGKANCDDVFSHIKHLLGADILGMTPCVRNNVYYEFWYNDDGVLIPEDRNTPLEKALGGGAICFGPGVVLVRQNENDTMKVEDYANILDEWGKHWSNLNRPNAFVDVMSFAGAKKEIQYYNSIAH